MTVQVIVMFRNNFQIRSIFAILFGTLSLVLIAMLMSFVDQDRHWRSENFIFVGFLGLSFFLSICMFLKFDFVRHTMQGVGYLAMIGWVGFLFFLYREGEINLSGHQLDEFLGFCGITVMVSCFSIGLIALFGSEKVREEFLKNKN